MIPLANDHLTLCNCTLFKWYRFFVHNISIIYLFWAFLHGEFLLEVQRWNTKYQKYFSGHFLQIVHAEIHRLQFCFHTFGLDSIMLSLTKKNVDCFVLTLCFSCCLFIFFFHPAASASDIDLVFVPQCACVSSRELACERVCDSKTIY